MQTIALWRSLEGGQGQLIGQWEIKTEAFDKAKMAAAEAMKADIDHWTLPVTYTFTLEYITC